MYNTQFLLRISNSEKLMKEDHLNSLIVLTENSVDKKKEYDFI